MLVNMWMAREPITVAPGMWASEAASLMARRRVRHLAVVEEIGGETHLLGMVSSHDLARAYPPDLNPFSVMTADRPLRRPVAELMATAVVSIAPGAPIDEAARLLLAHKIGALPVVVGRRLVGMLTESDVLRAFLEITGAHERGIRVTLDATEDEDILATILALGRRHGLVLQSVQSTHHDGRRLATARLVGAGADAFVDALWRSGHRVLSVVPDRNDGD